MTIHPSAVVSPRAQIGEDCFIGPYSVIGDEVSMGAGVRIESHSVIDGHTQIGDGTHRALRLAGNEKLEQIFIHARLLFQGVLLTDTVPSC